MERALAEDHRATNTQPESNPYTDRGQSHVYVVWTFLLAYATQLARMQREWSHIHACNDYYILLLCFKLQVIPKIFCFKLQVILKILESQFFLKFD